MGKRIELEHIYRASTAKPSPTISELMAKLEAVEAEKALARSKTRERVKNWRAKKPKP